MSLFFHLVMPLLCVTHTVFAIKLEKNYNITSLNESSLLTRITSNTTGTLLNETAPRLNLDLNHKMYSKYVVGVMEFSIEDIYTLCGGSLVLPEAVLISSSCRKISKPLDYDKIIVIGTLSNRQQYSQRAYVEQWMIHPQYEKSVYMIKNDIGLLKLEEKFKLNTNRSIIPLSSTKLMKKYKFDDEYGDVTCNLIFWPFDFVDWKNQTAELSLSFVPISVIPRKVCRKLRVATIIATEQFCGKTASDDIVDNESGGPLICGNVQFGFFTKLVTATDKGTILIFTRVDIYEEYLKSYFPKIKFVDDFPDDHRRAPQSGGIDEITIRLPGALSSRSSDIREISIYYFTLIFNACFVILS